MTTAVGVKRAVLYSRVSSTGQAGERHSSLETQAARARAYCETNGLELVRSFTDVCSGRRDDRKSYLEAVAFALGGGCNVIVVQWLDRFGRNPREILRRIWELQEHKIEVVCTDEDVSQELVLLLRAGMAGAESRRTSERVRANMARSVSKGVHAARPPFGYRPVRVLGLDGRPQVQRWEQHPEEAAAVREAWRLYVQENKGYKAIADILSEKGYQAREGRPWAAFSLQHILNNPAIAGVLEYGKKPRPGNPQGEQVRIENFFPAIVSQAEWEQLQQRIAIRREHPKGKGSVSPFLLSGIAVCGHCGRPLTGRMGAKKKSNPNERYRNYYCSGALHGRAICTHYNGHAAHKLERAILEALGEYSNPKRVAELLRRDQGAALKRLEKEAGALSKRLGELDQDLSGNVALVKKGLLNEEEFRKVNEKAREERVRVAAATVEAAQRLDAARQAKDQAAALPAEVAGFLEAVESLPVQRAKAHLSMILKTARVWDDGRVELEFRG